MIQRIQSVYLFLAFLACVLCFFFPVASFLSEFAYYKLYITAFRSMAPGQTSVFSFTLILPLLALNIAVGAFSLLIALKYKDRIRQLKWLRITLLLNVLFIAILFFYSSVLIEKNLGIPPHYETAAYFPLISLVFLVLANRAIRKDEMLVRSMDRLR